MNRALVMGNVHILATVLVASATMPHRLTAWKVQKKAELRVYQGVDDVTVKYPYVVIVHPIRCTGFLITPEWGLTAAHCCEDELSHIQYGKLSIPLDETESKSKVIRSVSHPRYEYIVESRNDIALLLVSPTVRMDKYGTLSAVDYSTLLGLSAEYVGGGMTFIPKRKSRNNLKRYRLDSQRPLQIGQGVVSPCDSNDKGYICVSPRCTNKQLTMAGDSGAPLLVDKKIVGVLHGGPDLFETELLAGANRYFTPISPHQEWIHSVITSKFT